jgi:hypothetical protein
VCRADHGRRPASLQRQLSAEPRLEPRERQRNLSPLDSAIRLGHAQSRTVSSTLRFGRTPPSERPWIFGSASGRRIDKWCRRGELADADTSQVSGPRPVWVELRRLRRLALLRNESHRRHPPRHHIGFASRQRYLEVHLRSVVAIRYVERAGRRVSSGSRVVSALRRQGGHRRFSDNRPSRRFSGGKGRTAR